MASQRSKKENQEYHFKRRVMERYEISLTQHDIDCIKHQIRTQKGEFLYRQSNRISIWMIEVRGIHFPVVWDKLRNNPVTALEHDWVKERSLVFQQRKY